MIPRLGRVQRTGRDTPAQASESCWPLFFCCLFVVVSRSPRDRRKAALWLLFLPPASVRERKRHVVPLMYYSLFGSVGLEDRVSDDQCCWPATPASLSIAVCVPRRQHFSGDWLGCHAGLLRPYVDSAVAPYCRVRPEARRAARSVKGWGGM